MIYENFDELEENITKTFTDRFANYGPRPEASLWFCSKRQHARFEIIRDIIDNNRNQNHFTINDIGCGYGALLDYILKYQKKYLTSYNGFELAQNLIDFCENKYSAFDFSRFQLGIKNISSADFCVMSGTFNYAPHTSLEAWRNYLKHQLKKIWNVTDNSMVFNLMIENVAKISDSHICYEELPKILSFCNNQFGNSQVIKDHRLPREVTIVVSRT